MKEYERHDRNGMWIIDKPGTLVRMMIGDKGASVQFGAGNDWGRLDRAEALAYISEQSAKGFTIYYAPPETVWGDAIEIGPVAL